MKTVKSCKPEEEKFIFTEGIDYSKTKKTSIWGAGDKETLDLLKKVTLNGGWLNLAAGDGRYNLNLLEKANSVIATDIDESALNKLEQNTPGNFKQKLQINLFDITKKFPFENELFDGVFCTGVLHLFPERILQQIFCEIDRVLKSKGRIIMDFATDIKRVFPNGELYIRNSEPQYNLEESVKLLEGLLKEYEVKIVKSKVPEEKVRTRGFSYKFSCNFILLVADKR